MTIKLAIGADHRGREAASRLAEWLVRQGHQVDVVVPAPGEACDYPEPAFAVGQSVAGGAVDRGVLICGTGVGTCIAANKVRGVRAASVHDEITAEVSRAHADANIICLSADLLGQRLMEKILDTWLSTPFQGGRHVRRVQKIQAIEDGRDPRGITGS